MISLTAVRRVTGLSGMLVTPLIAIGFGAVVGVSPTVEDERSAIARYYEDLSFGRTMFGEWLELLAFVAVLVFAGGFLRLLGDHPDRWLGWIAVGAAGALGGCVAVGIAPLVAAAYLGDHGGLDDDYYVLLNAVRSGVHWLSTIYAGLWLFATGAAVLRVGILRRWLGWTALAIAVLMIGGVATPLAGGVDLGQMLMGLWLLVVGALLVFRGDRTPDARATTA